MSDFNIGKIFINLQNNINMLLKKTNNEQQFTLNNAQNNNVRNVNPNQNSGITGLTPNINASVSHQGPHHNQGLNPHLVEKMPEPVVMNTFANTDRSVFIRNILGLPQTLGDILMLVQNPNKPLIGGSLGMNNINPELLQNQTVLSSLFEETAPVKNPLTNPEAIINPVQTQVQTSNTQNPIFFSGMISLPDVAKVILQNGKHAAAELIIAMATSSKQGVDAKQLQDTLSIVNSCISMAESDNPAQSLKSLMLLYLPWLPLNEGVGFDLEINSENGENDSNNSKLTVLIQTKNFGNIKGEFVLSTSNSVDIYILCSDKFPKKTLEQALSVESKTHAMNTTIDIEEVTPIKTENNTNETKVNLSATNEMNPYLLLMAHSFIRNTIMIDNNASLSMAS